MATTQAPTLRHFVAYVEDQPGVLNRVTSLFRRRCYNIVSLNVGQTHEAGVSRMTFAVEADDDTALRIEANLYKLVNVLSVEDLTGKASLVRGLALIKVSVGPERRGEVLQICDVFRARAVDIGAETLTVEITGAQDKIDGLVAILRPFGITEMVQTGTLAMARGDKSAAAAAAAPPPSLRGVYAA